MKNQLRLVLLIGALALGTMPMAACGGPECGDGTTEKDGECVAEGTGGEGATCGDGTVEENGVCVPSEGLACGPKTEADDQGRCVIAADACESGETLDPNTGNCVAGTAECGEGTALDGTTGTCVPTADVCDDGTVFDDDSGLCLPGSSCRAGDVVVDGICASPAEEMASNADLAETENNDPMLGGTAEVLTVKAAGSATVFTGTIGAPEDLDADGELDQDVDAFSFEATEGDWFEISFQSLGLPSPYFWIEGPNNFVRVSPAMAGPGAARQVVIPQDGTYTISLVPLSWAYSNFVFGADDWDYVGSLEKIDTPTPTDANFNADGLNGTFGALSDNFFKLGGFDAGDLVTVTVDSVEDGAVGVMSTWNSPAELAGSTEIATGDTFNVVIPPSGDLFAVVDYEFLQATDVGYAISSERASNFQSVGILGDDDTTTSASQDITGGMVFSYVFSVSAGQVIEFSQSNDQDKALYTILKDVSGNILLSDRSTTADTGYRYFYSETGGTYILTVENFLTSSSTAATTVNFRTLTPNDLGTVGVGDVIDASVTEALDDGRSDFHILTASDSVTASGAFTTPNDEDIDVEFFDMSNSTLGSFSSTGSITVEDTIMGPGSVLVQVKADEAVPSYEVDLAFAQAPSVEVEPNDTTAEATPFEVGRSLLGSMTSSGEVDYYSFELTDDLADDEVFIIEMDKTNSGSIEVACFLLDDAGNDVGTIQPEGTGNGCMAMSDSLVAGETYYLKLERIYYSGSVDYQISSRIETGVLETEPNEDEANANPVDLAALLSGANIYGSMAENSDVDVFSFELAADQAADELLAFTSENIGKNSTAGRMTLLDGNSDVVASASVDGDIRVGGLSAGTYYLQFTRTGSSSYWYDVVYSVSVTEAAVTCGDGLVEGDEMCDGQDHCTATCEWEAGYVPPMINEDAITFTQGDTPITREIVATQCDSIASVTVDVDFGIGETWMDETTLVLTGPSGTSVTLHDEAEGPTSRSFVGNYPDDFTVHGPGSLDDFIGEDGAGVWKLEITYFYTGTAQFNSYTLNLNCD